MFTLAHLSDPHIAPLPTPRIKELLSKRLLGYLSWKTNRRYLFRRDVLDRMCVDINSHKPDHVAVTGDLINIALPSEFIQAEQWLEEFGAGDWITAIPGNHDAYVNVKPQIGTDRWRAYMTGDTGIQKELGIDGFDFPFIRTFEKIALIGTSTAIPTGPWIARGALGQPQIDRLSAVLGNLGEKGYFRIVLIHHPPLAGQARWRKALADAHALQTVLYEFGAELLLHGHNHRIMHTTFPTRSGQAHVVGVPAASAAHATAKPPAHYNLYRISRHKNAWTCLLQEHAYDAKKGRFHMAREISLI